MPFENHAFGFGMAKLPILDIHSWILMWGLPKKIKQKKNVLCENSVEVWGNDGKCYASGQCGPSLIPGWCRSWSRRLQSSQPKKISSSKNIFRFQLLKYKLGNQNKIIVTLTSNKLLEWSCAIDSLFLIDRNQLLLCFSRTYLLFIDNNSWSSLVSWPTKPGCLERNWRWIIYVCR